MDLTGADTATIDREPIGCRYRSDLVDLLDSLTKRLGHADRAATIRQALDALVETHYPGATAEHLKIGV